MRSDSSQVITIKDIIDQLFSQGRIYTAEGGPFNV